MNKNAVPRNPSMTPISLAGIIYPEQNHPLHDVIGACSARGSPQMEGGGGFQGGGGGPDIDTKKSFLYIHNLR
jgi:hypothetical protein